MNRHFVFVYGTLKRGEPNHHWLKSPQNGYARFVSVGQTAKKYPLVIASKYNIPFLLDSPGKGENVLGEIYEVDDKMLGRLDVLEDHPTFYVRDIDSVLLIENESDEKGLASNGKLMDCWVYFLRNFKPELLSETCLRDYRSRGSHGKPYAEREDRDPCYHASVDVLIS